MKKDVSYCLDKLVREQIVKAKRIIKNNLENSEEFLFGSIAKGKYSDRSDIDILILIEEDKSVKELRMIRHFLEDKIEEINLGRDVDIKIYSKNRFQEISQNPSFEKEILLDLIELGGWH